MSGAELGLGVVGLASLFNDAIEWFRYIQVAKDIDRKLQQHLLRFDNAQLRLSRWGEAAGLSEMHIDEDDPESAENSSSLELDERQKDQARKTFKAIIQTFKEHEETYRSFKPSTSGTSDGQAPVEPFGNGFDVGYRYIHRKMREIASKRMNNSPATSVSLRQKAKFAIYGDGQLTKLTKEINDLIDDLYQCFPLPTEKESELRSEELKSFTTLLRDFGEIIREHDENLASSLGGHLTQNTHGNMRYHNKGNVIQNQGIKYGGTDTQKVRMGRV